jgi:hypothetical protein
MGTMSEVLAYKRIKDLTRFSIYLFYISRFGNYFQNDD